MTIEQRFARVPDYHQLPSYGKVMQAIGWEVVPLKGCQLFVKRLGPVAFAKLQRPARVDLKELIAVQKQYRIVRLYLEPGLSLPLEGITDVGFRPTLTHYAYTKTLIVDLTGSEQRVLASFSKTTSYQMRRSLKLGVEYQAVAFAKLSMEEKEEILALHARWSREKKIAGYDDAFMKAFWQYMKEGTMILARVQGQLHGALFLLIHHRLGMYFYQFTSPEARSGLFIPSGLAYQAIKLSRERRCTLFDLCSAYDERYPKENVSWQGFSQHKARFHPTPIYYPGGFQRTIFPF